jgi:hypothetical protein
LGCWIGLSCCSAVAGAAPAASAYDVVVAWTPVDGVAGYKLYLRAGAAPYGSGIDLGGRAPDGDGVVRAVHAGLAVGQAYTFAVSSYGSGGESVLSNEVSVQRTASPTPTRIASATRTPTLAAPPPTPRPSSPAASATATRPRTWTPTRTFTRTFTPTFTPTWTPTRTVPSAAAADISAAGTIIARVMHPLGGGSRDLNVIRDGAMPPVGTMAHTWQYDSWDGRNAAGSDFIGYVFPTTYAFNQILFQEGMHFWDGGWFDSLQVQVYRNGRWERVSGVTLTPSYRGAAVAGFNAYLISFPPIAGSGLRLYGAPGGAADFISVGELRVFGTPLSASFSRALEEAEPSTTPTATPTWTPGEATPSSRSSVCLGDIRRDAEGRLVVAIETHLAAAAEAVDVQLAFDTRHLDFADATGGPAGSYVDVDAVTPGRIHVVAQADAAMDAIDPPLLVRFAADADPSRSPRLRLVSAAVDGEPARCRAR